MEFNKKIPGSYRGITHEIDILITDPPLRKGLRPQLIICECKCLSTKVDRPIVGHFSHVKSSVKAHTAIIFSANGFTAQAATLARNEGIILIDLQGVPWGDPYEWYSWFMSDGIITRARLKRHKRTGIHTVSSLIYTDGMGIPRELVKDIEGEDEPLPSNVISFPGSFTQLIDLGAGEGDDVWQAVTVDSQSGAISPAIAESIEAKQRFESRSLLEELANQDVESLNKLCSLVEEAEACSDQFAGFCKVGFAWLELAQRLSPTQREEILNWFAGDSIAPFLKILCSDLGTSMAKGRYLRAVTVDLCRDSLAPLSKSTIFGACTVSQLDLLEQQLRCSVVTRYYDPVDIALDGMRFYSPRISLDEWSNFISDVSIIECHTNSTKIFDGFDVTKLDRLSIPVLGMRSELRNLAGSSVRLHSFMDHFGLVSLSPFVFHDLVRGDVPSYCAVLDYNGAADLTRLPEVHLLQSAVTRWYSGSMNIRGHRPRNFLDSGILSLHSDFNADWATDAICFLDDLNRRLMPLRIETCAEIVDVSFCCFDRLGFGDVPRFCCILNHDGMSPAFVCRNDLRYLLRPLWSRSTVVAVSNCHCDHLGSGGTPVLCSDFKGDGRADLVRFMNGLDRLSHKLGSVELAEATGCHAYQLRALGLCDLRTLYADFNRDGLVEMFLRSPIGTKRATHSLSTLQLACAQVAGTCLQTPSIGQLGKYLPEARTLCWSLCPTKRKAMAWLLYSWAVTTFTPRHLVLNFPASQRLLHRAFGQWPFGAAHDMSRCKASGRISAFSTDQIGNPVLSHDADLVSDPVPHQILPSLSVNPTQTFTSSWLSPALSFSFAPKDRPQRPISTVTETWTFTGDQLDPGHYSP